MVSTTGIANKQTNKQINKQTNKQASKQTNKAKSQPANPKTNQQTKKPTKTNQPGPQAPLPPLCAWKICKASVAASSASMRLPRPRLSMLISWAHVSRFLHEESNWRLETNVPLFFTDMSFCWSRYCLWLSKLPSLALRLGRRESRLPGDLLSMPSSTRRLSVWLRCPLARCPLAHLPRLCQRQHQHGLATTVTLLPAAGLTGQDGLGTLPSKFSHPGSESAPGEQN